jgi:CPA2 family monovalent cation:H+ antiporter-2
MALDRLKPWLDARDGTPAAPTPVLADPVAPAPAPSRVSRPVKTDDIEVTRQQGHTVIIGCGRIGSWVSESLAQVGAPLFVIDEKDDVVAKLRARNVEAVAGSAPAILAAANLTQAKALLVAVPNAFETGQIVAQARAANRDLFIVAHAHSDAEAEYLASYGASAIVQGSREIAGAMVAQLPSAPSAMQTAQSS